MSGPKTSRYTLTPEQRRILEEQRKIERRKAVASEKIKKAQKNLLAIGSMFEKEKQISAELTTRYGQDNGVSAFIAELEEITAPTQTVVTRTNYNDVESLEASADMLDASLEKAEKLAEKISSFSEANEIIL
ncbi:MAG: hypothetical protein IJW21_04895, partial [Clostridia bacterium]|nr:hypothetical protein [Clostridia bacterium]